MKAIDAAEWEMRQLFIPIAIVEHHQMSDPLFDIYDISDRLSKIWKEIQIETRSNAFTVEPDCVLTINTRIAKSFDTEPGVFRDRDDWLSFIEECKCMDTIEASIDEDPGHILSWIFSQLYWHHLTKFRLATVWLFINAIRLQHGLPECRLSLDNLGAFLESLSGSGPPIYDGQTFSPDWYS